MSRQSEWMAARVAAGKCKFCGKPRGDSPSKVLCRPCSKQSRNYVRRKAGCKPWRPGGPGRPPKQTPKEVRADAIKSIKATMAKLGITLDDLR